MIPALHDGVVVLNQYTSDDMAAHLAGSRKRSASSWQNTYTAEDGTGMIRYQIHLTNP